MVLSLFIFKLCPYLIYYHNDLILYIQDLSYNLAYVYSNITISDFFDSPMILHADADSSSMGSNSSSSDIPLVSYMDRDTSGNNNTETNAETNTPDLSGRSGTNYGLNPAIDEARTNCSLVYELEDIDRLLKNEPAEADDILEKHNAYYDEVRAQVREMREDGIREYKESLERVGYAPHFAESEAREFDRHCKEDYIGSSTEDAKASLDEFIKNGKE